MSVIKFNLKQEHIDLLKVINWSIYNNNIVSVSENEDPSPFGGDNIYEDINLILNGKPLDFNPLDKFDEDVFTDIQKAEWDTLMSELPLALEVILRKQTFELGEYKARFHQRFNWKKTA